jgi:hypothetical protein
MQNESGARTILTFALGNFHFAMAEAEKRLNADN